MGKHFGHETYLRELARKERQATARAKREQRRQAKRAAKHASQNAQDRPGCAAGADQGVVIPETGTARFIAIGVSFLEE